MPTNRLPICPTTPTSATLTAPAPRHDVAAAVDRVPSSIRLSHPPRPTPDCSKRPSGRLELLSVHLGRRLGLYDPSGMPARSPSRPRDPYAIALRYAREWLEQQAVAGFVTVDDPDADAAIRRFRLSDEQEAVFVDARSPGPRLARRRHDRRHRACARRRRRRLPARHRCRVRTTACTCATGKAASTGPPTRALSPTGSTPPRWAPPPQRRPWRSDRRRRMRAGMGPDHSPRGVPGTPTSSASTRHRVDR